MVNGVTLELQSLNCCPSTRIKLNTNIIFFETPMKIDKNTANANAYYEKSNR